MDDSDGDDSHVTLVWYEGPEGEVAGNGAAYKICEIWELEPPD